MHRRPALSAAAQARLLSAASMRGARFPDLVEAAGWPTIRCAQKLSLLRSVGLAASGALCFPAKAGRPLEVQSYVTLASTSSAAIAAFETYCRDDEAIASAVALTGDADYSLWSFHADAATARTWSWALSLRPEIGRSTSRTMRILFGHTLAGAPLFSN